ncbi:flagellar hook-length control protein FliK [candidate division KSB1 bacterium]|nr:flagellar hook-length control protein FliK [candidate division KSB1 bacterium]
MISNQWLTSLFGMSLPSSGNSTNSHDGNDAPAMDFLQVLWQKMQPAAVRPESIAIARQENSSLLTKLNPQALRISPDIRSKLNNDFQPQLRKITELISTPESQAPVTSDQIGEIVQLIDQLLSDQNVSLDKIAIDVSAPTETGKVDAENLNNAKIVIQSGQQGLTLPKDNINPEGAQQNNGWISKLRDKIAQAIAETVGLKSFKLKTPTADTVIFDFQSQMMQTVTPSKPELITGPAVQKVSPDVKLVDKSTDTLPIQVLSDQQQSNDAESIKQLYAQLPERDKAILAAILQLQGFDQQELSEMLTIEPVLVMHQTDDASDFQAQLLTNDSDIFVKNSGVTVTDAMKNERPVNSSAFIVPASIESQLRDLPENDQVLIKQALGYLLGQAQGNIPDIGGEQLPNGRQQTGIVVETSVQQDSSLQFAEPVDSTKQTASIKIEKLNDTSKQNINIEPQKPVASSSKTRQINMPAGKEHTDSLTSRSNSTSIQIKHDVPKTDADVTVNDLPSDNEQQLTTKRILPLLQALFKTLGENDRNTLTATLNNIEIQNDPEPAATPSIRQQPISESDNVSERPTLSDDTTTESDTTTEPSDMEQIFDVLLDTLPKLSDDGQARLSEWVASLPIIPKFVNEQSDLLVIQPETNIQQSNVLQQETTPIADRPVTESESSEADQPTAENELTPQADKTSHDLDSGMIPVHILAEVVVKLTASVSDDGNAIIQAQWSEKFPEIPFENITAKPDNHLADQLVSREQVFAWLESVRQELSTQDSLNVVKSLLKLERVPAAGQFKIEQSENSEGLGNSTINADVDIQTPPEQAVRLISDQLSRAGKVALARIILSSDNAIVTEKTDSPAPLSPKVPAENVERLIQAMTDNGKAVYQNIIRFLRTTSKHEVSRELENANAVSVVNVEPPHGDDVANMDGMQPKTDKKLPVENRTAFSNEDGELIRNRFRKFVAQVAPKLSEAGQQQLYALMTRISNKETMPTTAQAPTIVEVTQQAPRADNQIPESAPPLQTVSLPNTHSDESGNTIETNSDQPQMSKSDQNKNAVVTIDISTSNKTENEFENSANYLENEPNDHQEQTANIRQNSHQLTPTPKDWQRAVTELFGESEQTNVDAVKQPVAHQAKHAFVAADNKQTDTFRSKSNIANPTGNGNISSKSDGIVATNSDVPRVAPAYQSDDVNELFPPAPEIFATTRMNDQPTSSEPLEPQVDSKMSMPEVMKRLATLFQLLQAEIPETERMELIQQWRDLQLPVMRRSASSEIIADIGPQKIVQTASPAIIPEVVAENQTMGLDEPASTDVKISIDRLASITAPDEEQTAATDKSFVSRILSHVTDTLKQVEQTVRQNSEQVGAREIAAVDRSAEFVRLRSKQTGAENVNQPHSLYSEKPKAISKELPDVNQNLPSQKIQASPESSVKQPAQAPAPVTNRPITALIKSLSPDDTEKLLTALKSLTGTAAPEQNVNRQIQSDDEKTQRLPLETTFGNREAKSIVRALQQVSLQLSTEGQQKIATTIRTILASEQSRKPDTMISITLDKTDEKSGLTIESKIINSIRTEQIKPVELVKTAEADRPVQVSDDNKQIQFRDRATEISKNTQIQSTENPDISERRAMATTHVASQPIDDTRTTNSVTNQMRQPVVMHPTQPPSMLSSIISTVQQVLSEQSHKSINQVTVSLSKDSEMNALLKTPSELVIDDTLEIPINGKQTSQSNQLKLIVKGDPGLLDSIRQQVVEQTRGMQLAPDKSMLALTMSNFRQNDAMQMVDDEGELTSAENEIVVAESDLPDVTKNDSSTKNMRVPINQHEKNLFTRANLHTILRANREMKVQPNQPAPAVMTTAANQTKQTDKSVDAPVSRENQDNVREPLTIKTENISRGSNASFEPTIQTESVITQTVHQSVKQSNTDAMNIPEQQPQMQAQLKSELKSNEAAANQTFETAESQNADGAEGKNPDLSGRHETQTKHKDDSSARPDHHREATHFIDALRRERVTTETIRQPAQVPHQRGNELDAFIKAERLVDQLSNQLRATWQQGRHELTIKLYPENLGQVNLKLSVEENIMALKIVVDNLDAKHLMEKNISQLQRTLGEQNLRIERFEVMLKQEMPQFSQHESSDARQQYQASDQRQHRHDQSFNLFPEQSIPEEMIPVESTTHRQRVQSGILEVVA